MLMLCYAMLIEQKSEPGRKRSAATQNLRQKVQNERQEASGDPRAENLERDVRGALQIEQIVLEV